MQLGGNSPRPQGPLQAPVSTMGPDPFRSPSVPQPAQPTAPIQQQPAPQMPTTPRPVAPVQNAPPPMMQTPADPVQVRQQLMTALGGRPRFTF
jgi:hypothetical protein